MNPSGIFCVIPSTLAVGEEFSIKVKVIGEIRVIKSANFAWKPFMPKLAGPFNRCVARKIQYIDNVLPEWNGKLVVNAEDALQGQDTLVFDGVNQGVFDGDMRPIREFRGFSWKTPGFHFIKLTDPVSGASVSTNPVYVSENAPESRMFWGDPHWQTFFSDGIRSPEELYAFARDEAFLDFGAISDHMEAVTNRQWEYFQAVANDYNDPGSFATLLGQEWTNHKDGHRNIYYRSDSIPAFRSNDPDCSTLEKLWSALDALGASADDVVAIPHHVSNKAMGCDWSLGWNPKYEKAVEIYSVWGSGETHENAGNTRPIRACEGEIDGTHVRDALNAGYKLGFVGGGDIHDGRPGDCLATSQPEVDHYKDLYPQGLTAARVSGLTRENIFDAIRENRTYATTHRRIFLDISKSENNGKLDLLVKTASDDGIDKVELIVNGEEVDSMRSSDDSRIAIGKFQVDFQSESDYCYVKTTTVDGDMAWSSPVYATE